MVRPAGGLRARALAAGVAASVAAAVIGIARRRGVLLRVEVSGPSMIPTLAPGDKLLVVPAFGKLVEGDLVAFDDPADPARLLVKRVTHVQAGSVEVAGDNEGASRDSREFGRVAVRAVRGRAIYRYSPPGRSGRIGRLAR